MKVLTIDDIFKDCVKRSPINRTLVVDESSDFDDIFKDCVKRSPINRTLVVDESSDYEF